MILSKVMSREMLFTEQMITIDFTRILCGEGEKRMSAACKTERSTEDFYEVRESFKTQTSVH